jgi:GNAT superfamily N-acetyltransferase
MTDMPSIRRYADRDLPQVRDLFIRVNRELAPEAMRDRFEAYIALALREEIDRISEYYGRPKASFWVAVEPDDSIVGMFGLEPAEGASLELRRMYVAPEARRRGLARVMLDRAEQIAAGEGADRLVLSTSEVQGAAVSLYETTGYRLVREERATAATNKTVGGDLRRFHFDKALRRDLTERTET